MIVCWHHNWIDCPAEIEVVRLSEEIKRLSSNPIVRTDRAVLNGKHGMFQRNLNSSPWSPLHVKRKKRRPKPIVGRLPIRPPFTKDEWSKMTVSDVAASRVFLDYFGNCLTEAARSDRAKVYLTMLTGIMHFGRLPDFAPRSLGKFLAEAEQQTLSLPKLEIALEAILGAVAERQIPLGLVGQFEFLATVGDFADHTAG